MCEIENQMGAWGHMENMESWPPSVRRIDYERTNKKAGGGNINFGVTETPRYSENIFLIVLDSQIFLKIKDISEIFRPKIQLKIFFEFL